MGERFRAWARAHPRASLFYPICLLSTLLLFLTAPLTGNGFVWLYIGALAMILFALRPSSPLHSAPVEGSTRGKRISTLIVATVTVLVCVLPMGALPIWNGEIPDHRNQYELMADAILEGRIDFNYGDEDLLAVLENPYDPEERSKAGVYYHWDHAYYNGHYYMYFGIVPVFLLFLPYRVLTGMPLTTYHATQIFVAAAILGIFALFHMLAKRFFGRMPHSVYLLLSVAFSVMSVWYSIAEPALYCTAITAAIALSVWSLYFFVRAVFYEERENRQILLATVGSLLGALVFGCRPPIGLANVLVIPLLAVFVRQRKFTAKRLLKLVLAAIPYVAVGVALMLYNYVRFDNPFEFGQAYQLTVADQSQYRVVLDAATLLRIINNTGYSFFTIGSLGMQFPYVSPVGVAFNFPILFLLAFLLSPAVIKELKERRLLLFTVGFIAAALLITAIDIVWSPYLLERYHMDIYFLLGIACFLVIGAKYRTYTERQRAGFSCAVSILSVFTVLSSALLCICTVGAYYSDRVAEIARMLHLA